MNNPKQNSQKLSFLETYFMDARHFQIVYLSIFLIYGIFALNWHQSSANPTGLEGYIILLVSCLVTQAVGIYFTTKDYRGLKSGLITALGLCLLLKGNSYLILVLASVLSIGSKYVIRVKGKHLFNPNNFGLVMVIVLSGFYNWIVDGSFSPEAWVSDGRWGSSIIMFFILGALGGLVLLRVNRLDSAIAFLIVFGGLVIGYDMLVLGWQSLDVPLHSLTNGSLLLFTFFMITDPMTTPNSRKARIIWTVILAVIAFLLVRKWQIYSAAPIYVLFALAPVTAMFDRWFGGEKYEWESDN